MFSRWQIMFKKTNWIEYSNIMKEKHYANEHPEKVLTKFCLYILFTTCIWLCIHEYNICMQAVHSCNFKVLTA